MNLAILSTVAWRSLVERKVTFVLLVLAVAGGVGFQIPNTANLDGYTAELLRQGVGRNLGQVQVSPQESEELEGAHALADALRALPLVRAATVRLSRPGLLLDKRRHTVAARVVGVEPDAEQAATGLCDRVATGHCPGTEGGLLLGSKIATTLGVTVGDKVRVVVPYEDLGELALSSQFQPVVGVLSEGGGFAADSDVFVLLPWLQSLSEADDVANAIALYVNDPEHIPALVTATQGVIAPLVVGGARVQPWWELNGFIASAVEGNRTLAAISGAMSVLAVAIPALALFMIHVMRERRKIATLAAIGFSRLDVFVIFVLKSAILGVLGVLPGIGLGALLCSYFEQHPIYAHDGFVITPVLSGPGILWPSLIIFVTTVLAGLAPAVIAARGNPALTLRDGA